MAINRAAKAECLRPGLGAPKSRPKGVMKFVFGQVGPGKDMKKITPHSAKGKSGKLPVRSK